MTPSNRSGSASRGSTLGTVLCAMALFLPNPAGAAEWNIDPVRVDLSPDQQTAAIVLRNDASLPTSLQIHAVAWSQVDGKDVYVPTREVLVSPPIVTLAPKTEQIIRVALRRQADPTSELSYRINLQELPPPPAPGFMGVQVALRVGLPIFVQPQRGSAKPIAVWKVSRTTDDQLKVSVSNHGNAHLQISDFVLYVAGHDQPLAGEAGSTYVLAGQTHEWLLTTRRQEKLSGGSLRLKAYTDAENIDMELMLEKP